MENSLIPCLPEIPLTREDVLEEINLIKEFFYSKRLEKIKNIELEIYKKVREHCEGISELGDGKEDKLKLTNLMFWMSSRVKVFKHYRDTRCNYLVKNKVIEDKLLENIIVLEIKFLNHCVSDFVNKIQKIKMMIEKCN